MQMSQRIFQLIHTNDIVLLANIQSTRLSHFPWVSMKAHCVADLVFCCSTWAGPCDHDRARGAGTRVTWKLTLMPAVQCCTGTLYKSLYVHMKAGIQGTAFICTYTQFLYMYTNFLCKHSTHMTKHQSTACIIYLQLDSEVTASFFLQSSPQLCGTVSSPLERRLGLMVLPQQQRQILGTYWERLRQLGQRQPSQLESGQVEKMEPP